MERVGSDGRRRHHPIITANDLWATSFTGLQLSPGPHTTLEKSTIPLSHEVYRSRGVAADKQGLISTIVKALYFLDDMGQKIYVSENALMNNVRGMAECVESAVTLTLESGTDHQFCGMMTALRVEDLRPIPNSPIFLLLALYGIQSKWKAFVKNCYLKANKLDSVSASSLKIVVELLHDLFAKIGYEIALSNYLRLEEKRLDEIAREHERLEEMKRRNAKAGPVSKKTLNLKKQVQRYIAEMNRWDDDTFAYGDRKLTVVLNFLRNTLEYDSDDLDPRADGQVRQCLFALRARLHLKAPRGDAENCTSG
uniref:Uncharacterized protein n=1 Tax=Globisporangium ultimum (strain ATCC 200006 / CBS 805.95 / DAOM BR144) TaxID=431595 RepID=K3XDM8_GLOUD